MANANGKKPDDEAEARRILERVSRDSEALGASSLARTANAHGAEDDDDPIVRLGKRIGRILGAIAVVVLLWHLVTTYVLN